MIRLSIFGAVSFLVYIFGMVEGAQDIATRFNLLLIGVTQSGAKANVSPQHLELFIWSLLTLFSIRIYLHAWIIDGSKKFQDEMKREHILRRIIDWLLRVFWIGAIALLPVALSSSCNVFTFFNKIPPFLYMFTIGISLLIWARIVLPTIKKYSNKSIKELKGFWIGFDTIITICCLLLVFTHDFNILSSLLPQNWAPLYQFVALNGILFITAVQIIYWFPSIYAEAKS